MKFMYYGCDELCAHPVKFLYIFYFAVDLVKKLNSSIVYNRFSGSYGILSQIYQIEAKSLQSFWIFRPLKLKLDELRV